MIDLILLVSIAAKSPTPSSVGPVAPVGVPTVPVGVPTIPPPTPVTPATPKPSYVTPPSAPGQSWSDKMWKRYQENRK
jgi:hypothetical protein